MLDIKKGSVTTPRISLLRESRSMDTLAMDNVFPHWNINEVIILAVHLRDDLGAMGTAFDMREPESHLTAFDEREKVRVACCIILLLEPSVIGIDLFCFWADGNVHFNHYPLHRVSV